MSRIVDHWDWGVLRDVLRDRGNHLQRDPRVGLRFNGSDLAQETYLKALAAKHVPDWVQDEKTQKAWLFSLQDKQVIDMFRRATAQKCDVREEQSLQNALRESSLDFDLPSPRPELLPPEEVARRERDERILAAINQLEPRMAEVMRLRKAGLKLREIAEQLEESIGTVSGIYTRGLDALKQLLGEEFEA